MASITKTVEFIAIEPEEQYDTLHYKRDGAEKSGRVYDEYSRTQMVGLKPGADIAVTWEKKGNYWNITKVERGTAQDAPKTGGKAPEQATEYQKPRDPKEQALINEEAARRDVVELFTNGKIDAKHPLVLRMFESLSRALPEGE